MPGGGAFDFLEKKGGGRCREHCHSLSRRLGGRAGRSRQDGRGRGRRAPFCERTNKREGERRGGGVRPSSSSLGRRGGGPAAAVKKKEICVCPISPANAAGPLPLRSGQIRVRGCQRGRRRRDGGGGRPCAFLFFLGGSVPARAALRAFFVSLLSPLGSFGARGRRHNKNERARGGSC